jgi:stage III sporulation protein AG
VNLSVWKKVKRLFFEKKDVEDADAGKESSSSEKLSFFHWILILACLGLAAMILHNYFSMKNDTEPAMSPVIQADVDGSKSKSEEVFGASRSSPKTMDDYEEVYENQLRDILSKIVGVGEVYVMVNLDSSELVEYKTNIRTQHSITNEKDGEGGSRQIEDNTKDEQTVIIRRDNGDEPVIVTTKKPRVRGVIVVASGAENIQVKTWITEAVNRVLDVPLHRISVLPKKG